MRRSSGEARTWSTKQTMRTEGTNGMYCVCREHVELAIDKFVDEYEDAPDLVNLQTTTFSAWTAPEHCEWCGNPAEILVV